MPKLTLYLRMDGLHEVRDGPTSILFFGVGRPCHFQQPCRTVKSRNEPHRPRTDGRAGREGLGTVIPETGGPAKLGPVAARLSLVLGDDPDRN